MKKLLLLALLAFSISEVKAQSFRFGAKGGFNYSDIQGKNLHKSSHQSKLGWHAGLMVNVQYPGNDWFSLQPELLYTRKGYEQTGSAFNITDNQGNLMYTEKQNALIRLNYLELPFMLNFRTGILVFEVGPQIAYLLDSGSDVFVTQTYPDGTQNSIDIASSSGSGNNLNKFDFGLATGLRLEGANGTALGARFSQNFGNIYKQSSLSLNPYEKGRNQIFQLYVSYLIPE